MTATYDCIATTTLGSSASTVTFSSISANYTDLVLVCSAKATSVGTQDVYLRFNSDTASNYSTTRMYGSGTSAASDRQTNNTYIYSIGYIGGSGTSSVFAPFTVNIMNYANTTTNKSVLIRWGSQGTADQYVLSAVGLWRSTSAINSITILLQSGSFDTSSIFSLYGIKAE